MLPPSLLMRSSGRAPVAGPTAAVERGLNTNAPSKLARLYSLRGQLGWSLTARVERPQFYRGGSTSERDHQVVPSRFHHLQPRIKLMSAGCTADTIRFDDEFVDANPHASAIRAPREVDSLIVHGLILRSTETIDRLSIDQPRVASVVHDRHGEIMMVDVVLDLLATREPGLDEFAPYRLIQRISLHDRFGWAHIHLRLLLNRGESDC